MADALFPPLDALAVAFYASVGMCIRFWLTWTTKDLDYGIVTTARQTLGPYCTTTSGASGFFLQNAFGCILIAAISRHKRALNPSHAAGLSSGLCGSITTFGTWMHACVTAALNGQTWMAFVGALSMFCVSVCSFSLGHHLAACGMHKQLAWESDSTGSEQPACEQANATSDEGARKRAMKIASDWALYVGDDGEDYRYKKRCESPLLVVSLCLVAATVSWQVSQGDIPGSLCVAFAPTGALLRWGLSRFNPRVTPFPWFTLIANILGSAAAGVAAAMGNRVASDSWEHVWWFVFGTAFGGCLSTVSTFIAELHSDKLGGLRSRAIYCAASFTSVAAILFAVANLIRCS